MLPVDTMSGQCDVLPDRSWRGGEIALDRREGVGALDNRPSGLIFPRPRLFEIANPTPRFADDVDRLNMLDKALRDRINSHHPHAGVGIERIGARAELLADIVLEQAVDQNHIAACE